MKKAIAVISDNKDAIRRKAVIIGGALVGLIVTGALLSKGNDNAEIIVIEETDAADSQE